MANQKRAIWLAVITTALSLSTFADAPQTPNFSSRWTATPMHRLKTENGVYEARTFMRFVFSSEGAYPVASVSYYKVPKPKNAAPRAFDPDETAAQIGKAMGFSSWHRRSQRNAKVYEQYWEPAHRIVRLYLVDNEDSFIASVAVWRTIYGTTIPVESELIQRKLTGTLESPIPWLDKAMSAALDLGGTSAYADPCPICSTNNPLNQMACAACMQSQLNNNLGQLNNNINALNQNAANANVNWGNSNVNWGNSNANWANSNANWANTNQNWANTNNELHRANDLLDKALQPGTAFMLGAATGAGVAFGGLVVSLVAEGVGALVKGLVELITGNMANQERLQKFEEKRNEYEKVKPELQKVEDMIDGSLKIMRMAEGANTHCNGTPASDPGGCPKWCNPPLSGGAPIKGLECLIAITSSNLESERQNLQLMDHIEQSTAGNSNVDAACRDQMVAGAAKLRELMHQNEELLNTLRKFNHQQVCDGMKDAIRGAYMAEQQLSSARARLTSEDSRRSWRNAQYDQEQTDRELSDHSLSSIESQKSSDLKRASQAWQDEIQRLDHDYMNSSYRDQYRAYKDWIDDQVGHCATHSESWVVHRLNANNEDITQREESGGGFQCGIPIFGLPACPNAWPKCRAHHQFDEPPDNMKGDWWDNYYRRRKRADQAYWAAYRQAQTNFNVQRENALSSRPDPLTAARARQKFDQWLNDMMFDQNVVAQTERLNRLDDKDTEVATLCAENW